MPLLSELLTAYYATDVVLRYVQCVLIPQQVPLFSIHKQCTLHQWFTTHYNVFVVCLYTSLYVWMATTGVIVVNRYISKRLYLLTTTL